MPHRFRAVAPQNYANAKVRQFAAAFARRLGLALTPQQLELSVQETVASLGQQALDTGRALRLVLRHDCQ
jgi:hypothetical protein